MVSFIGLKRFISNSLSFYLGDIKKRINNRDQEWDIIKRYTNPCEYIHTSVPGKRKSIAKRKPLSRSYFKMIELTQYFKLLEKVDKQTPMKSFHLAEGPGGFIEALCHLRQNKNDCYIGITLIDKNNNNVPGWKKSNLFLENISFQSDCFPCFLQPPDIPKTSSHRRRNWLTSTFFPFRNYRPCIFPLLHQ